MPSTAAIEVIGGFETTFLPGHGVDVADTTGHRRRWRADIDLLARTAVRRLRYPTYWHRVERDEGVYDWRETDEVLGHLGDLGLGVILDLVHHTSYPAWLTDGFADPRFRDAYLRFTEAVASRYPGIEEYTLFNEPFSTLFLAGHEGVWPPYHEGLDAFVAILDNVLPAVAEASRMWRDLLPGARHVWVDSCEHHTSAGPAADAFTAMANDRRFFVADLFLGRDLDPARPFVKEVARTRSGERLLGMTPGTFDVLGLDYYAHCQWHFTGPGQGEPLSPTPAPLSSLIAEYADRYERPCILSETNIRGFASDRASWLKYTLEQCATARAAGVAIEGWCWFPFVDSCDWDSLLYRCDGNVDPVGVYWLDQWLERRPSSMSRSYVAAAKGADPADLPAYRFREPVSRWLDGWLPHMAHWDWQDPPADEAATNPGARADAWFDLEVPRAG